MYRLTIGNKRYSSWSLRPWVLLRQFGIPFTEHQLDIYDSAGRAEVQRISTAGKVPVLTDGDLTISDSLAIVEYVAERHPELAIWPADTARRAAARSLAAEMHSGFAALRSELPMNCAADGRRLDWSEGVSRDIAQIVAHWTDCRRRAGADGPYLFGAFCATDAMFAPVAIRFRGYSVECDGAALAYTSALLDTPAVRAWREAGAREMRSVPHYEVGTG